jgi:hypothetical protein
MSSRWQRIAPVTGILAIALIVVAFIVGGEPPDADASGREVVSYYADNDSDTEVASLLLALGAAFFVFFIVTVAATLRRAEARVSALSIGVIAGGIMMAIGMLIFAGIGLTLGDVGGELEPAAAQALNALSEDLFFPVAGGTVVLSWTAGLAILRNGGLPRWLGWIAIVIGVAAVTPAGFFAFLAVGVWTLLASAVMLARPETV